MSSRWLIAIDLDGTLFDDSLEILPRIPPAVRRLQDAGHVVTLATGRMYQATRPFGKMLNISAPLICYQGALIQKNGTVIAHKTVPLEVAEEAVRFSQEQNLHLNVYRNDRLYVAQRTPEAEFYSTLSNVPFDEVGDLTTVLEAEPTKLVFIGDEKDTRYWLDMARERWSRRAQVVQSHARFVELTNQNVSKGQALLTLAETYGIPRERTFAVGDNLNDLSMVEAAAVGVAMGNAAPEVKDAADWTVPTVADAGLAVALERFFTDVLA